MSPPGSLANFIRSAVILLVAALSAQPLPADTTELPFGATQEPWREELISERLKRTLYTGNSPLLVVSDRGRIHVACVEESPEGDQVHHIQSSPQGLQREFVCMIPRSDAPLTGVETLALSLDRQQHPHLFLYTRNQIERQMVYEELWASRAGGRLGWQLATMRRSENRDGGAGFVAPKLVLDRAGNPHVFAYVHNGFREIHRVRHRYADGRGFGIESLPRVKGKTDSGAVAVTADPTGRLHVAYTATLALRNGNAEPGYPSPSLVYTTWSDGRWSDPEVVAEHLGTDAQDTSSPVTALGIGLSGRTAVHFLYVSGAARPGQAVRIEHLHGRVGAWQRMPVLATPPLTSPQSVEVTNLWDDGHGRLHAAITWDDSTRVMQFAQGTWTTLQETAGRVQGFALGRDGAPLLLTRDQQQLSLRRGNKR